MAERGSGSTRNPLAAYVPLEALVKPPVIRAPSKPKTDDLVNEMRAPSADDSTTQSQESEQLTNKRRKFEVKCRSKIKSNWTSKRSRCARVLRFRFPTVR